MNTTYFLNLVSGNVFRTKTTPALPSAYYLGLSRTAPTADGTGVVEPASSTGYARVQLNVLSEPNGGVVTNTASIDFPKSTSSWGTITHFVIYDAATGGNLLMYGQLSEQQEVGSATILTIETNALNLKVANPSA